MVEPFDAPRLWKFQVHRGNIVVKRLQEIGGSAAVKRRSLRGVMAGLVCRWSRRRCLLSSCFCHVAHMSDASDAPAATKA